MKENYSILIKGFEEPSDFVDTWSKMYKYSSLEYKYKDNIDRVFEDWEYFLELFRWKNGRGDKISKGKMKPIEGFYHNKKIEILRNLKNNFDWDIFEKEFEPTKSSTIWKIFLLHLINPEEFPIYDQHVFRFYKFVTTGKIEEIPNNNKEKYDSYKNGYKAWFNPLQKEYHLKSKKMDESFITYGQVLKFLKRFPIEKKAERV